MKIIYDKKSLLKTKIKPIDITKFDSTSLIEAFQHMSFQSRNLADACLIFDRMLKDKDCKIILHFIFRQYHYF